MKRTLALILTVALLAGLLAGCGAAKKAESGTSSVEDYKLIADGLVSRYENYQNIGIGCKLDYDWEIEGEEIIALLPEEKRDLVNMPVKAVQCGTYEEALEQTYNNIDASLMDREILDFTADLCVIYNDELYFFWGNKGLITYQDTEVEEITENGMVATSNLYTSGGELYEKDRFTIEKVNDHFKIVSMEIVEEYWG